MSIDKNSGKNISKRKTGSDVPFLDVPPDTAGQAADLSQLAEDIYASPSLDHDGLPNLSMPLETSVAQAVNNILQLAADLYTSPSLDNDGLPNLGTPIQTTLALKVSGPGSAVDNTICRFDATTGKLIQGTGIVISDTNDMSGIAALSANSLSAISNGLISGGALVLGSAIGSGTPTANELYQDLIPKAWALVQAAGTFSAGVNLTVSKIGTGQYSYSFKRNMASSPFAVVATPLTDGSTCSTSAYSVSGFTVHVRDSSNTLADTAHSVTVFGNQ